MSGNQLDRNDYNIASSQAAQANFETAASRLEAALADHDRAVKAALAVYEADGVSEKYAGLEAEWNAAGQAVREIISSIRNSLGINDDIARQALTQAANAIPG